MIPTSGTPAMAPGIIAPRIWFAPFGWLYRPVSFMGWVLTLGFAAAAWWAAGTADRYSLSVSDTAIAVFPYVALFVIILGWVASNTSNSKRHA